MDASLTGNQSSQISKKNYATVMIAVLECLEACKQAAVDGVKVASLTRAATQQM